MINVKVDVKNRQVFLDKTFIGNDSENLQEVLSFELENGTVEGIGRLEYKEGSVSNYLMLEKQGNKYTIPVKSILTKKGNVNMQLVITSDGEYVVTTDTKYKDKKQYYKKENNQYVLLIKGTDYNVNDTILITAYEYTNIPVFKSNVFYLYCGESINAVNEAPQGYELWIEQASAIINQANNLDIDIKTVGSDTKVEITRKDGTKKEATVSGGGTSNHNELNNLDYASSGHTGFQATINDLDSIRSGASLGATAVQDNNYVHTDNNYTTAEKTKLSGIEEGATKVEKTSDITNDSGFITKSVNDLDNYTKTSDLGALATKDTVDYETEVTNKPTIPTVDVNKNYVDTELAKKQNTIDSSNKLPASNVSGLSTVATSGNYNDLSNKPTIPSEVTESTVSGWGFTKNTGTYSKPASGIPKTDLSSEVQTSLGKADSALQAHQDISGKQDKLTSANAGSNVTITEVEGVVKINSTGSSKNNQWVNSKINFMGDSITEGYPGGSIVTKTYWQSLGEKLSATVRGYGIGGSTIADGSNPMYSRVLNMNQDVDLIFVFGGTNDFNNTSRLLGDQFIVSNNVRTLNVSTDTFYGALNQMCLNLINTFPNATYVLLTPIHRKNYANHKTDLEANSSGLYLDAYVTAIKNVGSWFSIPVIDLYSKSSLYPQIQAQKLAYFASDSDGLHPNTLGHEIIARVIYEELNTIGKKIPSTTTSYSITTSVTNGSYSGATSIISGNTATVTIVPNSGYTLPSDVTVTNATKSYNSSTGVITLSNPTGNVTIAATCESTTTYTITNNVTGGTASGPATIAQGGTATITITPNEGYYMPDSVTVIGATYTYSKANKTIALSNPTGNVSITVVCEQRQPQTYTITTAVTNGTYSGDTTITEGSTATVTIAASSGYSLPSTITVSGATYTYNSSTGVITLSSPTGNVTIEATCTSGTVWYSNHVNDTKISMQPTQNTGGFSLVYDSEPYNVGDVISKVRLYLQASGNMTVGIFNTVTKRIRASHVQTFSGTPSSSQYQVFDLDTAYTLGENELPFIRLGSDTGNFYHSSSTSLPRETLWYNIKPNEDAQSLVMTVSLYLDWG